MPTLNTYTKDTESNIVSSAPSGDGEIAFSTDTRKFFISDGSNWVQYNTSKSYGSYSLSETVNLSTKPLFHIDASNSNSLRNSSGTSPSNGDSISEAICLSSSKALSSSIVTEQPVYVSSSGTNIMGETSGDARIGGNPVLQFDGNQLLSYDINGTKGINNSYGMTGVLVFRQQPSSTGNPSGYNGLFGTTRSGFSVTSRDNYSYLYLNNRVGSQTSAWNITNSSVTNLSSVHPIILFVRIGHSPEGSITTHVNFNKNNSQYLAQYSLGSNVLYTAPTPLYGMTLAANYPHGLHNNSYRFHGEIGEFLYFDSMLNNFNCNIIANYLATKWSLNWDNI